MTIVMVWAQTPGGVIAADGELPWDVPEDFEHFRLTVAGRPVIVGRTTWESMPPRWRENRANPCPWRTTARETLIYSVWRCCFTFFETVEDGRVHSCLKKDRALPN